MTRDEGTLPRSSPNATSCELGGKCIVSGLDRHVLVLRAQSRNSFFVRIEAGQRLTWRVLRGAPYAGLPGGRVQHNGCASTRSAYTPVASRGRVV
jgi:hypothetical protein